MILNIVYRRGEVVSRIRSKCVLYFWVSAKERFERSSDLAKLRFLGAVEHVVGLNVAALRFQD